MELFLIIIVGLIVVLVFAGSIVASLPSETSGRLLKKLFKDNEGSK